MVFEINTLRIGWNFTPTDENLIEILQKWIQGDPFPELGEVQFLDFEPFQLPSVAVLPSLKAWFFFVRQYMHMEINTLKGWKGSWRLFDETIVKNWVPDRNWRRNLIVGMKRHYCFYGSNDLPTSWVAYEYHVHLKETNEILLQQKASNDERAIICLFLNGPTYHMGFFHFEDHKIVDLLVKRNQGLEEFPQFGLVHFFSKEPYQLPVFKHEEKRMYMLRVNDVLSVDRWATPRGRWKIDDNNTSSTCSPVMNAARTTVIGGKRLRKYYDHKNKPTVWNMYEYYTADQPYDQTTLRDGFFVVVLFKNELENLAPEMASDRIATSKAVNGESSGSTAQS